MNDLIHRIASDAVLDEAFNTLSKRHKEKPPNHDIWHLRFYWKKEKLRIQNELLNGVYQFLPCRVVRIPVDLSSASRKRLTANQPNYPIEADGKSGSIGVRCKTPSQPFTLPEKRYDSIVLVFGIAQVP